MNGWKWVGMPDPMDAYNLSWDSFCGSCLITVSWHVSFFS